MLPGELLLTQISLNAKHEAVKTRIVNLREQLSACETEEVSLDEQYRSLSLVFAQRLCKKFAQNCHVALPPEVSDGYFLDGVRVAC